MNYSQELYRHGISFYHTGTIKNGRKIVAYFFKLSKPVTPNQIAELRKTIPHIQTAHGVSEFAPELRSIVLTIPSKAELKRRTAL